MSHRWGEGREGGREGGREPESNRHKSVRGDLHQACLSGERDSARARVRASARESERQRKRSCERRST